MLFGLLKLEAVMFLLEVDEIDRNAQRFIPQDNTLLVSAVISESM